ncbi:AAA family ATPase [Streptomyces xantholiticus]|uniref:AAA family ATPase n=1 Tax=Streptomyces xantholiticus TaxID=68285 RepID=A0ABV1URV3_9ACTN
MRRAVLRSYTDWTSYDGIPRDEFALDPKAASETSLYEVGIVLGDGVRWTYGFELGARRIEGEWLFAYPKGRRQVWFERDAGREKIDFPGDRLHDRARLTRSLTPDALLLTRAGNAGHEQLTPVFDWFRENLVAHELAHVRVSGHGSDYWKMLSRALPASRQLKAELDDLGRRVWMGDLVKEAGSQERMPRA